MPELPDIELYRVRLSERLVGATLESLAFFNPFVLRSFAPRKEDVVGREVVGIERLGKRIVICLEGERFIVIHLMIAGRFQWHSPAPPAKKAMGKVLLSALRFSTGQLSLVEISTKKRASIHLVAGRDGLREHDRGGLRLLPELTGTPIPYPFPLPSTIIAARGRGAEADFKARLVATNRTLKRALTDPRAFDGIGNAYSDEILWEARLTPVRLTQRLTDEEIARLHLATVSTLSRWISTLQETIPGFPKPNEITAFRPDFAVHGRFGLPCPKCGSPVQRIVYSENEANYCAVCQNEGRLLADRSLSRLLKSDWPKTLEEMLGG